MAIKDLRAETAVIVWTQGHPYTHRRVSLLQTHPSGTIWPPISFPLVSSSRCTKTVETACNQTDTENWDLWSDERFSCSHRLTHSVLLLQMTKTLIEIIEYLIYLHLWVPLRLIMKAGHWGLICRLHRMEDNLINIHWCKQTVVAFMCAENTKDFMSFHVAF